MCLNVVLVREALVQVLLLEGFYLDKQGHPLDQAGTTHGERPTTAKRTRQQQSALTPRAKTDDSMKSQGAGNKTP